MKSLLRALVCAALVLAVLPAITLAAPLPAAQADEAPAAGAARTGAVGSTTASLQMPSGLTQSVTTVGANGSTTTLNDTAGTISLRRGAQVYTPPIPATTPAFTMQTALPASCQATTAGTLCDNLGTLTLNFSNPVTNPVVHVAGLGTVTGGTRGHDRLTLASSLPAGSNATLASVAPGASNLVLNGQTIDTANYNNNTACDAAGAAAASGGCGSVNVTGTVTSLTFSVSHYTRIYSDNNPLNPNDEFAIVATVGQDLGDAPASYDPTQAATHTVGDLKLGATIDADQRGAVNPTTSTAAVTAGASNNGTNGDGVDEDAFNPAPVTIPGSALGVANGYSQTVPLSGASKSGFVCGWIDFDKSGTFDTGERACSAQFAAGATSATLTWTVPATAAGGLTYARFRTAYGARTQIESPNGRADSGEVEDYQISVGQPDLSCNNIYALQGVPPRNVWRVTPSTGVLDHGLGLRDVDRRQQRRQPQCPGHQ